MDEFSNDVGPAHDPSGDPSPSNFGMQFVRCYEELLRRCSALLHAHGAGRRYYPADLADEVFVRLRERRAIFSSDEECLRVATNIAHSLLRDQVRVESRRERLLSLRAREPRLESGLELDLAEERDVLAQRIKELSDRSWLSAWLIELHFGEGVPVEVASARMLTPKRTTVRMLWRLRQVLRRDVE